MSDIGEAKKNFIGERIRFLRGETSQTGMAKRLRVTQSYMSQVELGKKIPSLETLLYIADCLHTTVGFLLGETNDPSPINDNNAMNGLLESEVPNLFSVINARDTHTHSAPLGDTAVSALTLLALLRDKLISNKETFTDQERVMLHSLLEMCTSALDTKLDSINHDF